MKEKHLISSIISTFCNCKICNAQPMEIYVDVKIKCEALFLQIIKITCKNIVEEMYNVNDSTHDKYSTLLESHCK